MSYVVLRKPNNVGAYNVWIRKMLEKKVLGPTYEPINKLFAERSDAYSILNQIQFDEGLKEYNDRHPRDKIEFRDLR
jgi:hypothetical protein